MSQIPLLEAIFRVPSATADEHRAMAKQAIQEALDAGRFQLTQVLISRQPALNRAMEVLTDNIQVKGQVHNTPHGFRDNLRIYFRVSEMRVGEHVRMPRLCAAKERITLSSGETRDGEKTWRAYAPGVYLLPLKDALAALTQYGVGVVDRHRTVRGTRRACFTEVGYEFHGRRVNTEHLALTRQDVFAERTEMPAVQAELPPPGMTSSDASLPPPAETRRERRATAP